ncbi:MAG: DUF1800 family protein, partial [Chitinophagales bacterium]
ILLQQKQTARYICTKLYRFFVNDKVNDLHVSQLAEVFYKSDYDIETVLRAIFTAEWFYDKRNIGALIKPPIDFLVGVFQLLEIKELPNDELVTKLQKALGQVLLAPPNVAGWGGGQEWILSSTLMLRMNLTGYLIQAALSEGNERGQGKRGKRKRFTKVKSMQLLKNQKIEFTMQQLRKDLVGLSVLEQANILADYLFQVPIDKKFLLNGVSELSNPNSQLLKVVENALSLPEYQLF